MLIYGAGLLKIKIEIPAFPHKPNIIVDIILLSKQVCSFQTPKISVLGIREYVTSWFDIYMIYNTNTITEFILI